MCFGNTKTQKTVDTTQNGTTDQTQSLPQWVSDAGQTNLNNALQLQSTGFTPYQGQQVADFSPQQQASFAGASDIANSATSGPIAQLTQNYATAGPQRVSATPIYANMSPYMNQYVAQALTPQLQMQDQQFANQNKAVDAGATQAGAFGDTGWGQLRGTTTQAQDAARAGLIGNAYNAAFNTAIGAGAQDSANQNAAQVTNANLAETALGRQLTGANAMQQQQTGAANLENQFGGQQTAQQQAKLNAPFNMWQMALQYPFQTQQLANQTLGTAAATAPRNTTGTTNSNGTQVTSAPDNSGWGMLGSLASIGLAPFTGGMSLAALPGMLGGMQGSNGLATDTANNGSGMYTGPAWQPGFAADGGSVKAGQPVVVGERGPEVIVPGADSVVVPNEVMRAAMEKRQAALAKQKQAQRKQPGTMKFGIAA